MSKKLQGITKAIKGLKTAFGGKKTRARNKKSTAELRNKATKDAFKKANSSRAELRNKATKDFFEKANSSRPDLEAKVKRKKKMESERPAVPTLRRDMKRKPVKKAKGGMVTKWESKWG